MRDNLDMASAAIWFKGVVKLEECHRQRREHWGRLRAVPVDGLLVRRDS